MVIVLDGDTPWENGGSGTYAVVHASPADMVARATELQPALQAVWSVVDRVNGYLVEKEPWKLAKNEANRDELAGILYAAAETLRILAILIQPVMPAAADRLWEQLGIGGDVADRRLPADVVWGGLAPGTKTMKGEALFPRLESEET